MPIRHIILTMLIAAAFTVCFSGCQRKQNENVITNEEVEVQLEYRMNYFISLHGSKENLEKVAGKKMAQIKEGYREAILFQLTAERSDH